MEAQPAQFVGPPCGQYGAHSFYRRFRYTKSGRTRDINLGEFFFVRISAEDDPCIGELQLLCSGRNNEQQLAALRLYFLPEQSPEGRLSHHGEHEVLAASDRVVLKLDDFVSWITEEVEWNHGIIAPCITNKTPVIKNENDKQEPHNDSNNNPTTESPESENSSSEESEGKNEVDLKEEKVQDNKGTRVHVLSYQSYCRYRTILKRVEGGDTSEWLQNSLVLALGGFTPSTFKTHILFARDSFEHDELAHHELNCEYLAPTIKGKRRKRKTKNTRSISPESNTSDECKALLVKTNQKANGMKQPPVKNEQEFLQRLFQFMKKRNTPIHRVPHLGFKQIDLYLFYSFAQKLGGYNKVTGKKMWKHVYDELGGNPGSTSAATCTRRHYERLLLPFERFMDGIVYKPGNRGKKSQKKKQQEESENKNEDNTPNNNEDNNNNPATDKPTESNPAINAEDAYTFTDSNHENSNSKDSNSNEFNLMCEEQQINSEDEDSKTVWSIQKQPDGKDEASQDKDEGKAVKPLIIQKGQSETFAEKERKWDEIRRKNAAARKWVRQSRSSRGCKTPVPEIPPFKQEKLEEVIPENKTPTSTNPKGKSEILDLLISQTVPDIPKEDSKANLVISDETDTDTKFVPPTTTPTPEEINAKVKIEKPTSKKRHKEYSFDKNNIPTTVKSENGKHAKSWCGYPGQLSVPESYGPSPVKGHLQHSYRTGTRSEPEYDHLLHTGRQSVGSISASSAVSFEPSGGEEKPAVPQRRPSVIQHTEHAAPSPSPSLSPKTPVLEAGRNISPTKEGRQHLNNSYSPKLNLLPSQIGYSMTGKVAEWLTKGVHEAVACRTPAVATEKNVELHDKVMMPSSCKTPGVVGAGKVPVNNTVKSRTGSKSPRSKYKQRNDSMVNVNYSAIPHGSNVTQQKMVHPTIHTYPSMTGVGKYQHQTYNQNHKIKSEFYPNGPYYTQPKRYKINHVVPTMPPPISSRPPTMSPFVRQTTYCTPPLSDIPKTTASTHNDYDSVVLDLTVRKKAPPIVTRPPIPPPPISVSPVPEGVCLDLSIKKKPSSGTPDNGIENITPPLPLSPNPSPHGLSYMQSSMKPLPTLIALQDFAAEEATRRNYSSRRIPNPPTQPVTGPPFVVPPNAGLYPGSTHSKLPPGMIASLPSVHYSKEIAKNLYSARHSQFSPYVIPPFYPSNWSSVVNTTPNSAKQASNSQPSPMSYKGMANHSVFPKDYPYNVKSSQFHPVLCKDNGHYPSNDKK